MPERFMIDLAPTRRVCDRTLDNKGGRNLWRRNMQHVEGLCKSLNLSVA
jgi:hypothetical protein